MWSNIKILVCCESQYINIMTHKLQIESVAIQIGPSEREKVLSYISFSRPEAVIISHEYNVENSFELCKAIKQLANPPLVHVLIPDYSYDVEEKYNQVGADGIIKLSTSGSDIVNSINNS